MMQNYQTGVLLSVKHQAMANLLKQSGKIEPLNARPVYRSFWRWLLNKPLYYEYEFSFVMEKQN